MFFKAGTLCLNFCFFFSCSPGTTKLEVSNHGKFVILEVDGSTGLVVGMQSQVTEQATSGKLRLALGGILINEEELMVQVQCLTFPGTRLPSLLICAVH